MQALAALFLMNNVHYIVKAVESSEALSVVGQDWVERHKDLIEQYGEEYQASSMYFTVQAIDADGCLVVLQLWNSSPYADSNTASRLSDWDVPSVPATLT